MDNFDSLWGEDFSLPDEKEKTKKIKEKISKPKEVKASAEKQVKSKKISIKERLDIITQEVYRVLGKQKDNVVVIKTYEELTNYISIAIRQGRIAIDTETNNSLDPVTCKLMGLCLYTPGQKQAYIPVNHVNPETLERLDWQLTEQQIRAALEMLLTANIRIIMHNGKFDYQVLKCTCGICLPIDWDTLIGAKLLDENELSAGLKQQYIAKIDPSQEKYDIENLFKNIEYALVDPYIFALYAATDSMMTDALEIWQMNKFKDPDLARVLRLAYDLEMPLVTVIAEMELAGMDVDQEYAELLSGKYHKKLAKVDAKIAEELKKLKPEIDAWRLTPEANMHPKKKTGEGEGKSKNEQLDEDINLASPTQLAILFYDVLKCPPVDKKSPRGTGEDALKAISEKLNLDICKLLIERRELVKLLTTYIDVIPELAKQWPDGRVRTHFNQYGAATGRLSSSNPINFQNIPSHNKEIRMLFQAKPGYKIIGSDFSAQEPRLTAFYAQDENMINAYLEGKDLYSVIASMSFDRKYEDCLEFYPEGTKIIFEGQEVICGKKTHLNKEGKQYRTYAKSILLGVLYGRGARSVGEQIGKTVEEAQEIIDKFFKAFPKVQKWINESMQNAHTYGYVEDIAGRRRRLPDIQLPKYEIKFVDKNQQLNGSFNPFIGCTDRIDDVSNKLLSKYRAKLDKIRYAKEYENIKTEALKDGLEIHSNTGFIAQAERQAVNSRVQGGAASLTKMALIDIYQDEKLRNLGGYLINAVHDEILIEAPEDVAEEAANRLVELMIMSAKKYVPNVPMACDPYIVSCWYIDEFAATVQSEFKKMLDKGIEPMQAFEELAEERCESTRSQLYELVGGFLPAVPYDVDTSYKSL